ncbi:MAG: hypothetical protein JWN04_6491 [Myxococcaceae bacterium]|nr:hypothetical protein [Myxococcaceae bacterium]
METCFVIMGFGKKPAYGTAGTRLLNLDSTFEAIIEPAVKQAGMRCIRADRVPLPGVIDRTMYEHLLAAELVIADISTANPNALYELGVRHALRPFSTIIMKEIDGDFLFDLNHLATLQYKHLGDDIGAREAKQKCDELVKVILAARAAARVDSPVYEILRELAQPFSQGLPKPLTETEATPVARALEEAKRAAASSKHLEASAAFAKVIELSTHGLVQPSDTPAIDPFVFQQCALHRYKSKHPDELTALKEAWDIIARLEPTISIDPETLGIAGAIQKQLFNVGKDRAALDLAIRLYGRGFELRHDYYNGENYSACLEKRAALEGYPPEEASYDHMTAHKTRASAVESLKLAFADPTSVERSDYKWMVASMANLSYALSERETGDRFADEFTQMKLADWERDSFENGKQQALQIAARRASGG